MTYLASRAIVDCIHEALRDSAGVLRTVPLDRFRGDAPAGLSDSAQTMRALVAPRLAASVPSVRRHPQSPLSNGSILLYSIGVEIRVVRTVTHIAQLSDSAHDALAALALEDCDVIRQALEYPNLRVTGAYVTGVGGTFPTGFVGGETLTLTIDGVPIAVVFGAVDQSAAEAGFAIDTAVGLAGVGDSLSVSRGQIRITSPMSGTVGASVAITGGTAAAALGLAGLTSTSRATGIVSGLLRYAGSRTEITRQVDQGAQLLSTIHSFTGAAKSAPEMAAA